MSIQDVLILVIIIIVVVAMIYYIRRRQYSKPVSGGGENSALTTGGKEVIKKSGKTSLSGMDQQEVAEYIMKSSRSDSDSVATELRLLKGEITSVISGYPGLVSYVKGIIPRTDNKNVKDAIEDIQDSLNIRKSGGAADDYNIRYDYESEYSFDNSSSGNITATGGIDQDTADEFLAIVKPYLRLTGGTRNFLSSAAKKLGKRFKYSQKTDRKKLVEAAEALVEEFRPKDAEELMAKAEVSYEWFVPASKSQILKLADDIPTEEFDLVNDKLVEEFRDYARKHSPKTLTKKTIEKLLEKSEPFLRKFKLKSAYSKKPKTVVKRAGAKAFEADVVGLLPLLRLLAVSLRDNSKLYDFFDLSKSLTGEKTKDMKQEILRGVVREAVEEDDEEKAARAKRQEEVLRELRWQQLRRLREAEILKQRREIDMEKEELREKLREEKKRKEEAEQRLREEEMKKDELREKLSEEEERKREAEQRLQEEERRKEEAEQRAREEEQERRRLSESGESGDSDES